MTLFSKGAAKFHVIENASLSMPPLFKTLHSKVNVCRIVFVVVFYKKKEALIKQTNSIGLIALRYLTKN